MRKTRRQITYIDHRQEEPVARTKQFYKKSEFDRAIRELTGIPRTHASVEEHVRINIYPEQAGSLFEQGTLPYS